jgi:hypothetical protein
VNSKTPGGTQWLLPQMSGAMHTFPQPDRPAPQLLLSVLVLAQYGVAGFGDEAPGHNVWPLVHEGPQMPLVHVFPLVHTCPHPAIPAPQFMLSFCVSAQYAAGTFPGPPAQYV